MSKNTDISPDKYPIYLMELYTAQQKKILDKLDRIELQNKERFDQIEAYVGMSDREKNKPIFYTTAQALEILSVSRNTLLSYRKKGILGYTKLEKKIFYSIDDINKIREIRSKTA